MGEIGSLIAISDVGCGVVFLKSALIAASLNVIINLNAIKDEVFVANNRKEMEHLLREGTRTADETLALVMTKLK